MAANEVTTGPNYETCMAVTCISVRNGREDQVKVGDNYLIDKMSIWIDSDGDAYGTVYEVKTGRRVGQMKLSHFSSFGGTIEW